MKWIHAGCNSLNFSPLSMIKCVIRRCGVKWYHISAQPQTVSLHSLSGQHMQTAQEPSCELLNPSFPTLLFVPTGRCTLKQTALRPVEAISDLFPISSSLPCFSFLLFRPPPLPKSSFSRLLSSAGRAWQCWRCARRTASCKQPSGCSLLSASEGRRDETAQNNPFRLAQSCDDVQWRGMFFFYHLFIYLFMFMSMWRFHSNWDNT